MSTVTLIGIDLGKHCFYLRSQDEKGRMVFCKKVSRSLMLTLLANLSVCVRLRATYSTKSWRRPPVRRLDRAGAAPYGTGGKSTLLGIRKRGDKSLRRLPVQCARVLMQRIETRCDLLGQWMRAMLTRRHSNVVACAPANRLARIAWAILAKGTHYQAYQPVGD